MKDLILIRQHFLDVLEDLQKGVTYGDLDDTFPSQDLKQIFVNEGCWIDPLEMFGMKMFTKIGMLLSKLRPVIMEKMSQIETLFDEKVTYRGENYNVIMEKSREKERKLMEQGIDWRKASLPDKVLYSVNPFLRRMGKYVA